MSDFHPFDAVRVIFVSFFLSLGSPQEESSSSSKVPTKNGEERHEEE